MSAEAPIQIDLSQDNSWSQIDDSMLSENEKNLLAEQFKEESEGIIYLTQQELKNFKDIISSEIPDTVISGLQEFKTEQLTEGLSSSDIIGDNDILSEEDMSTLDSVAQETLFGDGGVFEGMNISPTAQDHMSVALTLSIINLISNKENITREDITKLTSGEGALKDELETNLNGLKQVVLSFVEMEDDLDANTLDIAGNGERNFLFMKTAKGKEFFDKVLSGELKPENMEEYIEAQNLGTDVELPNGIVNNVTKLGITGKESLEQLQTKLQALAADLRGAPAATGSRPPDLGRSTETNKESSGLMRFLENLFKMFGLDKLMEGVIQDGDEDGSGEKTEKPEEIAPTRINTIRTSLLSKLSEGSFLDIQDESIKIFLEGDGNMEKFLTTVRDIPTFNGQDTLEEKIENMLFSNIQSEETNKFIDFIQAGSLDDIKNTDGTFNGENFLKAATSYKNYRIAHNSNNNLTFEAFFTDSNE